jgi:YD repeat-containing protein
LSIKNHGHGLGIAVLGIFTLSAVLSIAHGQDYYGNDPAGRLTTARYSDGLCSVYTYDANGNLIRQINSADLHATPTLWGGANWNSLDWTSSYQWSNYGEGGVWGCLQWN